MAGNWQMVMNSRRAVLPSVASMSGLSLSHRPTFSGRPTTLDKIKNLYHQIHLGGLVRRLQDKPRMMKSPSPRHAWRGLGLWEARYLGGSECDVLRTFRWVAPI